MLAPASGGTPFHPASGPASLVARPTSTRREFDMASSTPSQSSLPAGPRALLESAAARAHEAAVFADVAIKGTMLEATALASAAPASFRLFFDRGKLWVSLVTADRWLSQSIEADLVHTGDKLDDLLHEELVDLGYAGLAPGFEHFRSEDKLFTFRSVVPVNIDHPSAADKETAATFLLGYEACFRNLGDMEADEEE
jgi:hypothetical protein